VAAKKLARRKVLGAKRTLRKRKDWTREKRGKCRVSYVERCRKASKRRETSPKSVRQKERRGGTGDSGEENTRERIEIDTSGVASKKDKRKKTT